jgi:hypothetical protein
MKEKKSQFLELSPYFFSIATVTLLLLPSFGVVVYSDSSTPPPGPTPQYSSWQDAVTNLPVQSPGCYVANYPVVQWTPGGENCVTPPSMPLTVGAGNDWEDYSYSPNIAQAQGWVTISGYSSESDSLKGTNYYSIQVNTNQFYTTYAGKGTYALEQFVFANTPSTGPPYSACSNNAGCVFIQYWLINYGTCPTTHPYLTVWTAHGSSCYADSNIGFKTPVENPSGLSSYQQKGYADLSGNDESVFCNGTQCYATVVPYTILNLAADWYLSEWNVLGWGGGSGACFNAAGNPCPAPSGSPSFKVTQYLYNSGGADLTSVCNYGGASGETNNLNLPSSCYANSGYNNGMYYSYIYFTMT